jgi:hypothetical protein
LSDGLSSSTTPSSRLLFAGALAVAIGICQSCGAAPSEKYLENHYEEFVSETVPPDAENVTRAPVKRTDWSQSASWEFETKQTGSQYAEWLRGKPRGQFSIAKSAPDEITFAQNLNGDMVSLAVRCKPGSAKLHVRVDAWIRPD